MKLLRSITWIAGLAMASAMFPAQALELGPKAQRFIQRMVDQHGYSEAEVSRLLRNSQHQQSILDAMSRRAEARPWHAYRPIFLTQTRIDDGAEFWSEHRDTLARAEEIYGVNAEIIVAIIGVETFFGRRAGRHRVIDALVTLGFNHPRRGKFFTSELEHFLLLAQEESLAPLKILGSYAGAMGVPQFIASSYRRYAVDFDQDGRRDLIHGISDSIGSVANYLARHGWQRGQLVTVPAQVDGEKYPKLLARGLKPKTPWAEMRHYGVSSKVQVPPDSLGALVALENGKGMEYWLGLKNFYVITRYNHSALYAMAVYQLAEEIRQKYSGNG